MDCISVEDANCWRYAIFQEWLGTKIISLSLKYICILSNIKNNIVFKPLEMLEIILQKCSKISGINVADVYV